MRFNIVAEYSENDILVMLPSRALSCCEMWKTIFLRSALQRLHNTLKSVYLLIHFISSCYIIFMSRDIMVLIYDFYFKRKVRRSIFVKRISFYFRNRSMISHEFGNAKCREACYMKLQSFSFRLTPDLTCYDYSTRRYRRIYRSWSRTDGRSRPGCDAPRMRNQSLYSYSCGGRGPTA